MVSAELATEQEMYNIIVALIKNTRGSQFGNYCFRMLEQVVSHNLHGYFHSLALELARIVVPKKNHCRSPRSRESLDRLQYLLVSRNFGAVGGLGYIDRDTDEEENSLTSET